eukprot:7176489-Alexandrium_andersonii.AAC.1
MCASQRRRPRRAARRGAAWPWAGERRGSARTTQGLTAGRWLLARRTNGGSRVGRRKPLP